MVGIQILIVKFFQLCYMFESVHNKNVVKRMFHLKCITFLFT